MASTTTPSTATTCAHAILLLLLLSCYYCLPTEAYFVTKRSYCLPGSERQSFPLGFGSSHCCYRRAPVKVNTVTTYTTTASLATRSGTEAQELANVEGEQEVIDPAGPSVELLRLRNRESLTFYRRRQERTSSGPGGLGPEHEFRVRRVSNTPHIFLFENLLSNEECKSLMSASSTDCGGGDGAVDVDVDIDIDDNYNGDVGENNGSLTNSKIECVEGGEDDDDVVVDMKEAAITQGDANIRSNCQVGWVPNAKTNTNTKNNQGSARSLALEIGRIVGNILMTDAAKLNGWSEPLQLVYYNAEGGKFDLHYDGLYRSITVIYYLNGVGNTWFPFAQIGDGDHINIENKNGNDNSPSNRDEAVQLVQKLNLQPGIHGILAAGTKSQILSQGGLNVESTVKVRAGDAIAFFNYKSVIDGTGVNSGNECDEEKDNTASIDTSSNTLNLKREWRAIHAGLPTTLQEGEKWIANHWIHHLPFQKDWEQVEQL